MITLSAVIMAHPKRADQVGGIMRRLDRGVDVVWDERNDRWDTGRRAMLAYDPACSHHAVLQDDVLVCRDLFAGVTQALEFIPPDAPVCGYVGRVRPYAQLVTIAAHRARQIGASWLTMQTLNWGPLIVVPTAVIPAMIAHCDTLDDIQNYDRRLSRFFELQRQVRIWYTWPSLVDHADGPSLVPGRVGTNHASSGGRIAHTFLGEDRSALDVDWTGRVVDMNGVRDARVICRNPATGQALELRPESPRVRRLMRLPFWELEFEGKPL